MKHYTAMYQFSHIPELTVYMQIVDEGQFTTFSWEFKCNSGEHKKDERLF